MPLDGAAAPTRQPHRLADDGLVPYPARGRGVLSVRWSGGTVTTHYLTLYGRAPPAKTQGCIAVSARLLIRMRPLVQVQPGPQNSTWPAETLLPLPSGSGRLGRYATRCRSHSGLRSHHLACWTVTRARLNHKTEPQVLGAALPDLFTEPAREESGLTSAGHCLSRPSWWASAAASPRPATPSLVRM
jgi:hypothetical protein